MYSSVSFKKNHPPALLSQLFRARLMRLNTIHLFISLAEGAHATKRFNNYVGQAFLFVTGPRADRARDTFPGHATIFFSYFSHSIPPCVSCRLSGHSEQTASTRGIERVTSQPLIIIHMFDI